MNNVLSFPQKQYEKDTLASKKIQNMQAGETVSELVKEKQNKLINKEEFLKVVDLITERGYFTPQEREQVIQDANNEDIQRLASIWLAMQGAGWFLDLEAGIVAGISTGAVYGWPVGMAVASTLTAVGMVVNNRMVHYMGKGMEQQKSLKKLVMIPQVGKHMPLVFLIKDHAAFLKALWVYKSTKSLRKKRSKIEDKDATEYIILEAKELEKVDKSMQSFEQFERKLKRWKGFLQKFFKDIRDRSIRVSNIIASPFRSRPRLQLVANDMIPMPVAA